MRYPKGSFTKTFKYNGLPIRATVVDAKQSVTIVRTVADALSGKKADPERCMDANCVLRNSKTGAFPHPVLAVWVIKSRAYVLRSANPRTGKYVVVRYNHNDWTDIERFDKGHKFTADKKISFLVPSSTTALGGDKRPPRSGNQPAVKPSGRVMKPKGLAARFVSLRQWQETAEIAGKA